MLNSFFDKFIFTNTLHYTHNNFYLLNTPFAIVPVEILTGLTENLGKEEQKKVYESIKKSTKEKFVTGFAKSFGSDSKKEFEVTKDFFIASGWGKIDVIDFQMESKRTIIVLENSPFAQNQKEKNKSADVLARAVFAGLFSSIFSEDIDCVETECAAQNKERCKFVIKPKTEFDFSNPVVQEQLNAD